MKLFLKIIAGLFIIIAVALGITSINHPIILKWVTGSAKHHGQSLPATVYTNGKLNEAIKVFYSDEVDNYLLYFPGHSHEFKFLNINLEDKSVSKPIATSENDFDLIAGHLFQSEARQEFSSFQDATKNSFDPELTFTDNTIRFKMPPDNGKLDSVRIILP